MTTQEKELHRSGGVIVNPDIQNTGEPVTVRIVVVGTVLGDNEPTDETVGAYVDVTLQP